MNYTVGILIVFVGLLLITRGVSLLATLIKITAAVALIGFCVYNF
jgi:hypothetical protein